jgi:S-formylglutathione hydrolase FrmB
MQPTEHHWQSHSLGKAARFSLALPDGNAPAHGWPLVLLLHGRGRDHLSITTHPDFPRWFHAKRFALLCPMGDDGWWIDSPAVPASRYQSMLIELLEHARRLAPLTRDPRRTGVMGWSMGGYGSAKFATDHPNAVAALATIIGLLDFPNAGDATYPPPAIMGGPAQWPALNPMTNIESLREKSAHIFAAKQAWDYAMNLRFHERLTTAGIAHAYTEYDGEHHIRAVEHAMPRAFAWMDERLNAA